MAKIVYKYISSKSPSAFSLGFLCLLLWLGIPVQALGDTHLEALKESTSLEEAIGTLRNPNGRGFPLPQKTLPPLEVHESLERVTHRTRTGETLTKLLGQLGLSKEQRKPWLRSVQKHYPTNGLHPGKELHFYFTKNSPILSGKGKRDLKALEIEHGEDWMLTWERGDKRIVFSRRERPYDIEFKTVGGVVERSLFDDGLRVGLNPTLLSQLADIFAWEIDFDKEIKRGDTFKLLYEERSRKGRQGKALYRILAAELISSGQKYLALYFEKERGKGSYYDLDGRSLARAFLRFPLEFIGITSPFSHSRFHPLLKMDRPHYGVDFAAKRGTPVRAVGDGKITNVGWAQGGYGRVIEIQHDSAFSSLYAHLQGFAQGIRKGITVKKGQIIGYVGSSGRTTGAHLHFELYKDQQFVDPLRFQFPPEDNIEPALRKIFDSSKLFLLTALASTPHS